MTKIDKLRGVLNNNNLEFLLITNRYNMNYFSGYSGDTGVLLISHRDLFLFTDFRYIEKARKEAKEFICVDINNMKYSKCILQCIMGSSNYRSLTSFLIGYEYNYISHCNYVDYMNVFKEQGLEVIPVKDEVDLIRGVKDEFEIANISHAAKITDDTFSYILDVIKEGITEKEIACEIEYFMKKQGAERLSFDTIVASGSNSSMPHAVPTDKKVQFGDFITIDMGCIYNGYCSDMTRTIGIGAINDHQRNIYNIVLEAQLKALESIREGIECSVIDGVARNIIKQHGYGDCFGHSLGHSVGLYIHEEPRFASKSKDITKVNNVITVEPGIYISGEFGVRIEDLVVVKEKGLVNLCTSEKKLIIL